MAIRIILALLAIMGGVITVWAQLGGSELMTTTHCITEALNDPDCTASGLDVQGQIRALALHEQLWNALIYMGLGVFALAASGFFVLSRRSKGASVSSHDRNGL
jgi:hypothetical protein